MVQFRHPLTGALYQLEGDGSIRVDDKGTVGYFGADGHHISGELTQADLHLLGWISTKPRRHGDPQHPFFADPNAASSQ